MRFYELEQLFEFKSYELDGDFPGSPSRLVFENPAKIQIWNLIKKTEFDQLRIYVNPGTYDLYVWDSGLGIHSEIVRLLESVHGIIVRFDPAYRGYITTHGMLAWKKLEISFKYESNVLEHLATKPYYQRLLTIDGDGRGWITK